VLYAAASDMLDLEEKSAMLCVCWQL